MALQTVNIGSAPNDGTGDPARTAFGKVNDNFAELYGIYGSEVETQTFTSKQDDLAINDYTRILRWDGAGTTGITGLSLAAGRVATIVNASTDYLLWLENQNTASAATNRFLLPDGFPAFLLPGDSITVWKDGTTDRVRVLDWPARGKAMGLSTFTDCDSVITDAYDSRNSGTGVSWGSGSAEGINTTSRALGVTYCGAGTTSTGYSYRAYASSTCAMIAPTLGAAITVCRIKSQSEPTAAEEYGILCGFHDDGTGTLADGVYWEKWWNGSAAAMSRTVASGGVIARSAAAVLTSSGSWVWLIVFVNPAWTRADYIYSTDSISFSLDGSISSGLPTATQLVGPQFGIRKRAGTTDRSVYFDLLGHRVSQVRA